jgi:uncharacterized protein with PQ loop repeat
VTAPDRRDRADPPPDRPAARRTSLERVAYVVAIVGPLTTCPQIVQIFSTKSAEDVSIPAWIGFTLYSAFWVVYGASRKDWPLTLANALWSALQLVVVLGATLYR